MQLLLIRHGIAAPEGPGLPDHARPLTPEGRERWQQAVRGLQRLGVQLDRVCHSPLRRAVETAELLMPLLRGEAVRSAALASPPGQAWLDELRGECVALVGHQPWMGEAVAWLTTHARQRGSTLVFKRGGVAWLEGPPQPGRMVLRAFLPPKVLRTLAEVSAPRN
ncbi:MAG: phosphohistidine phosphatase SixA [Candidatus Tectimicrobiota bacterium]